MFNYIISNWYILVIVVTICIALMGVAHGLGIPAPIAAGAIVSGAYFGDKMSPLSDTTNLAPAMAGTHVFTHVKFMIKPTANILCNYIDNICSCRISVWWC